MMAVAEFVRSLFDTSGFQARWHCGTWSNMHGWLHIISDVLVFGAYLAIPGVLVFFAATRRSVPFLRVFWLFGAFIFACGTTHLMEAVIFWWPAYRLSGLLKLSTAVASWATVFAIVPLLPRAMRLPRLARIHSQLEERFRLLVNAVEDYAIIMLDTNGHVVSWNAGARRITGYRSRDVLGRHYSCFYTAEDVSAGLPARHLSIAARRGRIAIEGQRVRADGERFPAEVVITALRDDNQQLQGFAKVTHDETQRKRLEREIADAAAAEQQRIGQDLHDGLGQELTGLVYQAERLRRQLERTESPFVSVAADLVEGIQKSLGQVRMLSKGLIPVEVDSDGLRAALEELTEHVHELYGIPCDFICRQPAPVDDANTATQLYRIAQESLTNAARHASPSRLTVELKAHENNLELIITDDGTGFDTTHEAAGSGLRIMHYRAGLIGARLQLNSERNEGTRVVCRVKVKKSGGPPGARDHGTDTAAESE